MERVGRDLEGAFRGLSFLFLLFAGVLIFLILLLLLAFSQLAGLGGETAETLVSILFIPIVINVFYLSPALPKTLLYLLLASIFSMLIFIFRVVTEYKLLLRRLVLKIPLINRLSKISLPPVKTLRRRRYGIGVLLFISLGATIGPSAFVIIPLAVQKYGSAALLGMFIAGVSSVMLARGYYKMYVYSRKMGGGAGLRSGEEPIGGPAFVKNAYGKKHPSYISSRLAMWIGNTALSAFNLLVAVKFLSDYVVPMLGFERSFLFEIGFLALLSIILLKLYDKWGEVVGLQLLFGSVFIALFVTHIVGLYFSFSQLQSLSPTQISGTDWNIYVVLTAAAYVYIVIFGFQEVMALAEEAEGETLEEKAKNMAIAMLGGTIISIILFILYMLVYVDIKSKGISIPETSIPALDLVSANPTLYAVSMVAFGLGILTTLVAAYIAALKHLREFIYDVFKVEKERAEKLLLLIIILLMWYLFFSGTEFIVHLTDYATLLALSLIALSEVKLKKKLEGCEKVKAYHGLAGKVVALLTFLMLIFLASESPETAWISVFIMLTATLLVIVASYDILLAEIFTVLVCALTLLFSSQLINLVRELANFGMLSPGDIALWEGAMIALWGLYVVLFALVAHLFARYSRAILKAISGLISIAALSLRRRRGQRYGRQRSTAPSRRH
mgnify:CR=1 FL=1